MPGFAGKIVAAVIVGKLFSGLHAFNACDYPHATLLPEYTAIGVAATVVDERRAIPTVEAIYIEAAAKLHDRISSIRCPLGGFGITYDRPLNSMILTPQGIALTAKTPSPEILEFLTIKGNAAFLMTFFRMCPLCDGWQNLVINFVAAAVATLATVPVVNSPFLRCACSLQSRSETNATCVQRSDSLQLQRSYLHINDGRLAYVCDPQI